MENHARDELKKSTDSYSFALLEQIDPCALPIVGVQWTQLHQKIDVNKPTH